MDLGEYIGLPMPAGAAAASDEGDSLLARYDELIADLEIPAVLQRAAEAIAQHCRAERATVYLIERETHELASVAVIGNVARTIRVPIDHGSLAGHCVLTGRAMVIPDAYGDLVAIDPRLRFDPAWDRLNGFRTRDVLCAPVRFGGRVLGVAQAINGLDGTLDDDALSALVALARLIGYALYHACLYRDLADLKALEREKAQFMRIMVHELKSPVSAATMLADALGLAHQDKPDVAGAMDRIKTRMTQMTQLIQDVLELARTKSGEPLGDVAVLDVAEAVRAGVDDHREPAEAKGLQLRADLPAGPVPARFDSQGLAMVISNLLSNAVKYTEAGHVGVAVRRNDTWAELEVRDSGIGIPAADIPKLFQEFHRASNAKRKQIPGSGVGLASVKCMVERFGGHMEIRSTEGAGSTFVVRLPLHA